MKQRTRYELQQTNGYNSNGEPAIERVITGHNSLKMLCLNAYKRGQLAVGNPTVYDNHSGCRITNDVAVNIATGADFDDLLEWGDLDVEMINPTRI